MTRHSSMLKRVRSVAGLACIALALAVVVVSPPAAYAAADDLPTLDDLLNLSGDKPAADDDAGDPQTDGEAPAPDDADADALPQDKPAGLELDPALLDKLTGDAAGQPLEQALTLMRSAAQRLDARMDSGVETQRIQRDVLAKLDQVIADAQKRQPKSSSSSSSSSSQQQQQQDTGSQQNQAQQQQQQAQGQQQGEGQEQGEDGENRDNESRESGTASGPGSAQQAQPDESQMHEYREEWGNLPARLREDLMQGLNERYSSVYEELTRAYYRRLAQEQE